MAAFVTTVSGQPASQAVQHPKMTLSTETGSLNLQMRYAPKQVTHAALAPAYTTAERAGRTALLLRNDDPLPTMQFDIFLSHGNDKTFSIEWVLLRLKDLAMAKERVKVRLGQLESGWWRITTLEITSVERKFGTNEIVQANISLTFTRASDARINVGPTSGGVRPPSAPTTTTATSTASRTARTYTVKAGDTLSGIAIAVYHDYAMWTKIASANGIRDPRTLQIGQKLVLP